MMRELSMTKKNKDKKYYLRSIIIFGVLAIISILIYARYVGTTGLIVKEYIITHEKLTTNFDGLQIVHFSDLHYGTTVFLTEVEYLVNQINRMRPDIIVFTGDLIDNHYDIPEESLNDLINAFNEINPSITSFMVRGNHDQNENFDTFIQRTNFKLLENEHQMFYFQGNTPLVIVGLDNPYSGNLDISAAFDGLNDEYYTILIAHQPDVFNDLENYNIQLFLAGHSHGGQVRLPLIGSVVRNYGSTLFHDAEYQIGDARIFVSSGIGTSKYHFRLFNRPSINLYRFSAQ